MGFLSAIGLGQFARGGARKPQPGLANFETNYWAPDRDAVLQQMQAPQVPDGRPEQGPPPGMDPEAWAQGEAYLNQINPGRRQRGTFGLPYQDPTQGGLGGGWVPGQPDVYGPSQNDPWQATDQGGWGNWQLQQPQPRLTQPQPRWGQPQPRFGQTQPRFGSAYGNGLSPLGPFGRGQRR